MSLIVSLAMNQSFAEIYRFTASIKFSTDTGKHFALPLDGAAAIHLIHTLDR
jgi:hypothetical protein